MLAKYVQFIFKALVHVLTDILQQQLGTWIQEHIIAITTTFILLNDIFY